MVGWHFPLLLLAAFLSYATTVMGHFHDNPMAALLLWAVVWGLLFSRSVIQTMASRDHVLLPDVDWAQYRESLVVSWIVVGSWALTPGPGLVDAVDRDLLVPHGRCRLRWPDRQSTGRGAGVH